MTYLLLGIYLFGLVIVGVQLGLWAAGKLGYRKPPPRKVWWWIVAYSAMAAVAIVLVNVVR